MKRGPRSLAQVLCEQAKSAPEAPALLTTGQPPLSYGSLLERVDYIRDACNNRGLGRENRIAIVLPRDTNLAVALLGVASCATALPLNDTYTETELETALTELRAEAIIIDRDGGQAARHTAARLGLHIIELCQDSNEPAGMFELIGGSSSKIKRPGPAEASDVVLVLRTSGTTTRARMVPITASELIRKAFNTVQLLGLESSDRCLNPMPPFHAHGIYEGLVAPLVAGGSTFYLPGFESRLFFETLRDLEPTYYTGSFTYHYAVLAALEKYKPDVSGLHLRFLRSGSGRLAPWAIEKLEQILGVAVVVSYATTETGTLAATPRRLGASLEDQVGVPLPELSTVDEAGRLQAVNEPGEIVVRGPHVSGPYENSPTASREAYKNGWFHTGDVGLIDSEGHLNLKGRIKEIINRGGEKISPLEVENAVAAHPSVSAALAFSIPHPTLGEEVGTAVIYRKGAEVSEKQLKQFVRYRLAPFKVPRRLVSVPEFPKGPTGKTFRVGMAKFLGLTEETDDRASQSPTSPLQETLASLWASVLDREHIGPDEDFFLLGGDSLQAVELVASIEEKLGQRLPSATLLEAGTVREMARVIEEQKPSGCLVAIRPNGSRPPFFAIHDNTGEVLSYHQLVRHLDPDQPFYALQSLGLDRSRDPLGSIDEMAELYLEEIRTIQPHGPYFLGGFSFGGRVAYVMARKLHQRGESVSLLALIDSYSFAGQKHLTLPQWLARHWRRLWRHQPADRLPYLLDGARRILKGAWRRVALMVFELGWRCYKPRGRELPRFLRRPRLANFMARKYYRAEPYAGDAVLFRAEVLHPWMHQDAHEAWKQLITGNLRIVDVPGAHLDLIREPHVVELARKLDLTLAEAQGAIQD